MVQEIVKTQADSSWFRTSIGAGNVVVGVATLSSLSVLGSNLDLGVYSERRGKRALRPKNSTLDN